jgi:hypothetical protein
MTTSGAPLQKTLTLAPPSIQIATVARLREELKGMVKILLALLDAKSRSVNLSFAGTPECIKYSMSPISVTFP